MQADQGAGFAAEVQLLLGAQMATGSFLKMALAAYRAAATVASWVGSTLFTRPWARSFGKLRLRPVCAKLCWLGQ